MLIGAIRDELTGMSIMMRMLDELTAWSKLFRENFQILLLSFLYISVLIGIMHMGHDASDVDNISFAREVATGVGGCLFGMLKVGRESSRSGEPTPATTTTATVTTTTEAPK